MQKCPIPWKTDPVLGGISTNIPCFRVSLAKVDPHLGTFSLRTNPVVPHTHITKYMDEPPPPHG